MGGGGRRASPAAWGGSAPAGIGSDLRPAGAPARRGRKPRVPAGWRLSSRARHVVVRRPVRQPLHPLWRLSRAPMAL